MEEYENEEYDELNYLNCAMHMGQLGKLSICINDCFKNFKKFFLKANF